MHKFYYSCRYDKIFILDRLSFIYDGLRIEKGDREAQEIHEKIIDGYKSAGYQIITVPIMSIENRTSFILEKIGIL